MENVQIITIPVRTTMDPAELLDIALKIGEELEGWIESHGEEATVLEEEVSVEDGDEIYGGESE
jgi:hypothetical protein